MKRGTAGQESRAYLPVFVSLLQDNPEVEKRDPQELVGKYPRGSLGGRCLSLAQSELASRHARACHCMGLLSASAKAAVLLRALSSCALSGPLAFPKMSE